MFWPRPLSTLYIPSNFTKICKVLNSQISAPKISEVGLKTWVTISVITVVTITLCPNSWDAVVARKDSLHISWDSNEWGQASRENRVLFVHVE